jgi:hypothetical protein
MQASARWAIEFSGENPEGVEEVFRFSDGFYHEVIDQVAWIPQLSVAGMFSESFFAGSVLPSDKTGLGFSEVVNTNGHLDFMANYAFDGRLIRIFKIIDSARVLYGVGAIKQLVFDIHKITINILDVAELLENNLPFEEYLGTNYYGDGDLTGVEGTKDDLKGSVKPKLYGKVSQASPILVNSALLIFQVADSDCIISNVYDGGIPLGVGGRYTSLQDMYNNQPAAGTYRQFEGYFRLGASLVSTVTVDASSLGNLGLGSVFKRVVDDYESLVPLYVRPSSIAELDSKYSEVNCYFSDEVAAIAVLDGLMGSVGGGWSVTAEGEIWMSEIHAPDASVTPVLLEDYNSLKVSRSDSGIKGVPIFKIQAGYDKVSTLQDQLLGAADAEFLARVSMEYRKVSVTNDIVKARHPLSTELSLDTMLIDEIETEDMVNRLSTLLMVRREIVEAEFVMNFFDKPKILQTMKFFHHRFYPEGKLFIVISSSIDSVKNTITLKLWG